MGGTRSTDQGDPPGWAAGMGPVSGGGSSWGSGVLGAMGRVKRALVVAAVAAMVG